MQGRASRQGMRIRAFGAVVLVGALVLLGLGPARADNSIDHQLNQASDDFVTASKAVNVAMSQWAAARQQLPAARAKAQAASKELARAHALHDRAVKAATLASAAAVTAATRVHAAQREIDSTNNAIDSLIRNVYAQGPYSELAGILTATTPSEFAERLASLQAVAQSLF